MWLIRFVWMMIVVVSLHAEMVEGNGESYDFEAAQSFCEDRGQGWRALDIRELFALRGDPRFSKGHAFWSSNTVRDEVRSLGTGSEGEGGERRLLKAYASYLQDGDITIAPLEKKIGVICTNETFTPKKLRVERNGAVVVDSSNKLMWHHLDAWDRETKFTFEAAREHCESLKLEGRSWRLPYVEELYSIVVYDGRQPSVDKEVFGFMQSKYYWTDDEFQDSSAYVVGFKRGSVATSKKTNKSYVRCVSDID